MKIKWHKKLKNIIILTLSLSLRAGNWLNPPPDLNKRRGLVKKQALAKMEWDYVKKNPTELLFVFLYFLINATLFIWVAIQRKDEGVWVIVARTQGMCLNFNSVFILVLMMKGSLTWLRSTKLGRYFPIDNHIEFHKAVAIVIIIQAVFHFIGHLGRHSKCYHNKYSVGFFKKNYRPFS